MSMYVPHSNEILFVYIHRINNGSGTDQLSPLCWKPNIFFLLYVKCNTPACFLIFINVETMILKTCISKPPNITLVLHHITAQVRIYRVSIMLKFKQKDFCLCLYCNTCLCTSCSCKTRPLTFEVTLCVLYYGSGTDQLSPQC